MKRVFCTCFDHNYSVYGLTLFESLKKYMTDFDLYVLCLSDDVFQMLQGLSPEIIPVSLNELEEFCPELSQCKKNRNRAEYIFTLSPIFPLFLFHKYKKIERLAYLDSDLLFFSSPEFLFEESQNKSLYITKHRFSVMAEEREAKYGKYNVAFQIYRNDAVGIQCLTRWKEQCIQWCYDRFENGRFADQKYLDSWPEEYPGAVFVEKRAGINEALWNMGGSKITHTKEGLFFDGNKLVFFHFQGYKLLSGHFALWQQEEDHMRSWKYIQYLAKVYFSSLKSTMKKYPRFFCGKFTVPARFYENSLKFTRMEKYISKIRWQKFQFLVRVIYFYFRNPHSFFFKF